MKSQTTMVRLLFVMVFSFSVLQNTLAQSVEFDKRMGAENAKMVEMHMGLYPDSALTNYVQSIGYKLVDCIDENPFEFQFAIVDDGMPNAFALPGGYIYVTRGILSLAETEDELACVIGHEITHVLSRHSVKQMRKSILPSLLEVPGALIGGLVNEELGSLINAPIHTGNILLMAKHSRKHEYEADSKGIELAARAGYNPDAMADILERLAHSIEVFTKQKEERNYFADHPYTPDRLDNIHEVSPALHRGRGEQITSSYCHELSQMLFGDNPERGVFIDELFLHPELMFSITFPEGWETSNQPEAVGAVNKEHKSGMYLSLADSSKTPFMCADDFKYELAIKNGKRPNHQEEIDLGLSRAYVMTFEEQSEEGAVTVQMLWTKINGLMYHLVCYTPKGEGEVFMAAAKSLHPLTEDEKPLVMRKKIILCESELGETFEDLCKRNANVINSDITAAINDLEHDHRFTEIETVKVVVEVPYF